MNTGFPVLQQYDRAAWRAISYVTGRRSNQLNYAPKPELATDS